MKSLKEEVFNGIAWRSSADFGQMILLIAFTTILARLLNRADFGLVAMALLVNRFINQITQVGFGTAIVQSQEVTDSEISAVFFIQVGINFLVSLICFFCAPLAAIFFNEPRVESILRALAWLIFIDSLGFPKILLVKRLRFGGISILELSSMVLGNFVGIYLALKGFGAWALVFRSLVQHVFSSIFVWPIARWLPVRPDFMSIGKLFRFGIQMLGSKVFNYFSQNLAAIILGKFIGVATLGSYNIAYNLAILPAQKVQSVLTSVLTSAFSKIQYDIENFRKKFFISLFLLGLIFIPIMFGLSAVAKNLVLVLYGQKWREAGLFLTFLAVIGLLRGIKHLLNSVIIAKGWVSTFLIITIVEVSVELPLLYVGGSFFGASGIILAFTAATIVSFGISVLAVQKAVEEKNIFLRATDRSLIIGAIMFAIVFGSSMILRLPPLALLLTQILIGVVIYIFLRIKFLSVEEKVWIKIIPLSRLVLVNK